jgi:sporulation protein YlmC with PRC-barrel domain
VEQWVRRQDVVGREVDTTGGTKVGVIGDVIINDDDGVIGFKLARVFVEGPIAKKQTIAREVVVDTGAVDGVMTIDLAQAEQHELTLS